jgi:hypothetical protein
MSVGKVLKRKAKGVRPYFFDDPSVDRVVSMVMGLAGEVAVLHDRLDTVERLLDAQGGIKREAIEAYKPTAAVAAERAEWREGFLGEVLRIVEIEVEALTLGDTEKYDTAIRAVEKDAPAPTAKKTAARKKK